MAFLLTVLLTSATTLGQQMDMSQMGSGDSLAWRMPPGGPNMAMMMAPFMGLVPAVTPFLPGPGMDVDMLPEAMVGGVRLAGRWRHASARGAGPTTGDQWSSRQSLRLQWTVSRAHHPGSAECQGSPWSSRTASTLPPHCVGMAYAWRIASMGCPVRRSRRCRSGRRIRPRSTFRTRGSSGTTPISGRISRRT